MNTNLRKTIIASSIAALIALPAWAASDASQDQSNTPTTAPQSGTPSGTPSGASSSMGQGDGGATGAQSPAGATSGGAADSSSPNAASSSGSNSASDNPLHSRTAGDLEGVDIVNAQGEKIASIDAVVLSADRSEAHAVIDVGATLGMGGHTTLVSLDELTTAGEDELRIDATEDELKARPEYDDEEGGYVELESDAIIGGAMN